MDDRIDDPGGVDPSASRWILLGMLGLVVAGALGFALLRRAAAPPPPEVARDPLLFQGRVIYLGRCATCHGLEGRGDGPIAGSLLGPPVGNLASGRWKCGDAPADVERVIARGVPDTRMAGWDQVLDPGQVRAAAAYVYYLAGRPVPDPLRLPAPAAEGG